MRVKCVVDTNVLISASLTKGAPFQVVEHLIKNNALIFSKETISELSSRITQPKFDKYVSADDREAYVNNLILSADLVIIDNLIQGCRDRDDDKFLETAVRGDADEYHRILRDMGNKKTVGDIDCQFMDYEKVENYFGWTPQHGINDGIAKTIKWYKRYLRGANIE